MAVDPEVQHQVSAPRGAAGRSGPLTGIRVVDLSANMTGPYATQILADQGADVVKVEPPGGDVIRRVGTGGRQGLSTFFANLNRSKRSVVVDLQEPGGAAVVQRLLENADVLVQNFRPGVIDRLGLGSAEVLERHPRLVYVSISGFGAEGALAAVPAYDHVVQAYSGMAALQAPKGGEPTLIRHGLVDKATGIMAAEAVLAALIARGRTGRGTHVEISMLDVALSFLWPDGMMNQTCLDPVEVLPSIAGTFRLTATSDGFVALVTLTDAQWENLIRAAGLEELLDDPNLVGHAGRLVHGGQVMRQIGAVLAQLPTDKVVELLREHDVPCMPVLALDEVVEHIEAVRPGTFERTDHPILGWIQQPRPPVSFGGEVGGTSPAPAVGADTDEVLAGVGLSNEEIADLRRRGVIR